MASLALMTPALVRFMASTAAVMRVMAMRRI
jgi:hypothetical protein